MDVPIGALGDGFEDRLVLESRSDLARWGGGLLYLLMVPFCFMGASMMSLLLWVGSIACGWLEPDQALIAGASSIALLFVVLLALLFREYRAREFQEIALRGSQLEVRGRGPVELADVKSWPQGMSFLGTSGRRYLVRSLSEEKKLLVMERVLPGMAAAQRAVLESGKEIRLPRSWGRVGSMFFQGFFGSFVLTLLGSLASPILGLVLGGLFFGWYCFPMLRDFSSPGLIFSRTGLRRLGQPLELEVPWREVESCWVGTFFQDTLRVTTQRGRFSLVSGRNPVVWALMIRELQQA